MNQSSVEALFLLLDETAQILENELSCTYLEALALTAENIFQKELLQENLNSDAEKRLKSHYNQMDADFLKREVVRKALQLAILKGMKEHVQPNHQMTPDGVGILVSYLVQKLFPSEETFSILDLAVGTGNLLTTILNDQPSKELAAFGVDVDEVLISLAYVNANLQKHRIEFFNQDSLEPLLIDPVDLVVADVPVGYYPNDLRASEFELRAEEGHSFAHHLFIEQSCRHVRPGGYMIFVIPSDLFESEQAGKLHAFIKENLLIIGLLQLPATMFVNKQASKSIFILQKKKEEIAQPKQALLVDLPSLSNAPAMEKIIGQMDEWFLTYKEGINKNLK